MRLWLPVLLLSLLVPVAAARADDDDDDPKAAKTRPQVIKPKPPEPAKKAEPAAPVVKKTAAEAPAAAPAPKKAPEAAPRPAPSPPPAPAPRERPPQVTADADKAGGRPVKVRLVDGSTVVGQVHAEQPEHLVIECALGRLSIPRQRISTIAYDAASGVTAGGQKRAPVQELGDDPPKRK